MKNLIFIDNDNIKRSKEDFRFIRQYLEQSKVPEEKISSIKFVPDFHHLSRDEKQEIVFDSKNVVLTWSMYTITHFNSLGQTISLLRTAGQCNLKGLTYIDFSGEFVKCIEYALKHQNITNPLHVLFCFNSNNIITQLNSDFYLIKVKIQDIDTSFFATKIININDYL